MRALVVTFFTLVAAAVIAACGGGSSTMGPPPPTNPPTIPPTVTPTPTATPVLCTKGTSIAAFSLPHFAVAMPVQVVPRPPFHMPFPGPARPLCDRSRGRFHCMSWQRIDIAPAATPNPNFYGPADLQSAYKLPSSTGGTGQTVAIVDAFDDPGAEADLGVYRSFYGLSTCTTANGCFKKVNENGMATPLPTTDPSGGWEGEESLDLDMVSAVCPKCHIILFEATNDTGNGLFVAQNSAVSLGANVISNSWSGNEYNGQCADETTYFKHTGVITTFASGDNGYVSDTTTASQGGFPPTSQYVVAVGGTSLVMAANARGWTEAVWSGAGSACSVFEPQPSWQTALGSSYTSVCPRRISADVAAVADTNTPVNAYDTFGGTMGWKGWAGLGGTSVATPIVAAAYGLKGNAGSLSFAQSIYQNAGSLFDVTSGSNGACGGTFLCTGKAGYDGPTGLGTPNGVGAF